MTKSPLRLAQVVVVHDGLERGERAARRVVVQVVQIQHRPGLIEQEPEREFLRVLTSPRHEVDVRRLDHAGGHENEPSHELRRVLLRVRRRHQVRRQALREFQRRAFNTNSSRASSGGHPPGGATTTVIPSGPSMPSN
ncbi:hypothetical protein [Streptodolium elevatio]|uniref:Uncharacterized protein n=1 Tax=Streptodolium elevatio TaxID=3157996 RepID=A0ABV3DR81_9ACTN